LNIKSPFAAYLAPHAQDPAKWDAYCKKIANTRAWGDELEVLAIASLTNCVVTLVLTVGDCQTYSLIQDGETTASTGLPQLFLGYINGLHYTATREIGTDAETDAEPNTHGGVSRGIVDADAAGGGAHVLADAETGAGDAPDAHADELRDGGVVDAHAETGAGVAADAGANAPRDGGAKDADVETSAGDAADTGADELRDDSAAPLCYICKTIAKEGTAAVCSECNMHVHHACFKNGRGSYFIVPKKTPSPIQI
jgi:hypothetical protein